MIKKSLAMSVFVLSIATISAFASSTDNYVNGMLYMNGEKGASMQTKTMPNCPYEKCSDIQNKDGTHTFSFVKKDYKSAVKYLYKATAEDHDIRAAKELLGFLQHRLNWKEPKSDGYLISRMKEDVNIDMQSYKKYFKLSVDILVKNNICDGFVTAGDIANGGYLGETYDLKKAKSMYKKAISICPKDSYLGMTTAQKLNELNNADK